MPNRVIFSQSVVREMASRPAALRDLSAGFFERALDLAPLGGIAHIGQRHEALLPVACRPAREKVARHDPFAGRQRHGALDAVSQFPDIAGPSMGEGRLFGERAEAANAAIVRAAAAFSRNRSISQPMSSGRSPQRRDFDRQDRQAEIEVLAESRRRRALRQIAMRRRHDAGTEGDGRLAADASEAAVLDQPQQLCLQRQRHVADLIEEQRALARPLGIAEMALLGAREGALLVAEDLALEKLRRDRGAVDRDERLRRRAAKSGAAGAPPLPCLRRFRR